MQSKEELREACRSRRLSKDEKLAYIEHWQTSCLSQRLFCEQESLSLATFSSWIKSLSCKSTKEESKSGFVAVAVRRNTIKPAARLLLQFKLPSGLIIEGQFSFTEVGCFIKELSNGLTPLR